MSPAERASRRRRRPRRRGRARSAGADTAGTAPVDGSDDSTSSTDATRARTPTNGARRPRPADPKANTAGTDTASDARAANTTGRGAGTEKTTGRNAGGKGRDAERTPTDATAGAASGPATSTPRPGRTRGGHGGQPTPGQANRRGRGGQERNDRRRGQQHRRRQARGDDGTPRPRLRTVKETSAGGLVVDGLSGPRELQVAALIGRTDRRGRLLWSLPKGHIEDGETLDQTAMREVREETGVSSSVLAPLGAIDYWFVTEGRRVHKTVHHFLMQYTGGALCDEDVEVTEVAWVPLSELGSRLAYADERNLAIVAENLIDELDHATLAVVGPRRGPDTTRVGGPQRPPHRRGARLG